MRKSALTVALVAAVMVIPIAAVAIHSFTDVPDGAFYHNSVAWMKDNNITSGCNPPANTEYCPEDNVTRGEMAVFMKRLAESGVVDAATAVNATNATNAADAQALDGKTADYYQGSVAGAAISSVTPASGVATRISQVAGFAVPQSGGALYVSADMSMSATNPGDTVIVWLEVDGTGACDGTLPVTAGAHQFIAEQFGFLGVSTTAAASAGSHQVDLCMIGNGGITFGVGALSVMWVETTQVGTIATASTGMSPAEKLAEVTSSSFGD